MNFYEINDLKIDEESKNEFRLAFLSNIKVDNMLEALKSGCTDADYFREYRLWTVLGVPNIYFKLSLGLPVVRAITSVARKYSNIGVILDRYYSKLGVSTLDESSIVYILDKGVDNSDVFKYTYIGMSFELVKFYVDLVVQGININALLQSKIKDLDILNMLVAMLKRNMNISRYLKSGWSLEQLEFLAEIEDLEFINKVSSDCTVPMLEQLYKGYVLGIFNIIAAKDTNGLFIYNEYQLLELVEGARLGLDITKYADYRLSDKEMAAIRTDLTKKSNSSYRMVIGGK